MHSSAIFVDVETRISGTPHELLSRLRGCKRTGLDRWLALCPAHDDKHPSLSIRELDGDRVLVHCWTGCDVVDVLGAVGLGFDALYPARPTHRGKAERRPWPASDVLRATAQETLIVAVAAATLATGEPLSETDRDRVLLASRRLTAAVQEAGYA